MQSNLFQAMVKRSVDLAFSTTLLLLALPPLLVAALLIRLTSPGPILFRQTRMGRNFQPFQILKLRTMAHGQSGLAYTLGADPRITPLGHFLRRTKLDELPQLWNVLIGDMSLVGPRPVLPELTQEFREYYSFLLRARPGLTDPASLKYCQETALLDLAPDPMEFFKSVVTPDKLRISFEYMTRASLATDLATLAMTAMICLIPSISRIYGDLPHPQAGPTSPVPQPQRASRTAHLLVDEGVFTHSLAMLEAAAEDAAQNPRLPWISLPIPEFESRSSPTGAKESVSLL